MQYLEVHAWLHYSFFTGERSSGESLMSIQQFSLLLLLVHVGATPLLGFKVREMHYVNKFRDIATD